MFDIPAMDSRSRINDAGTLWEKRALHKKHERENFDWALCFMDRTRITVANGFFLENGTRISPTRVSTNVVPGRSVLVVTATQGLVKGQILSNQSLVVLPGNRIFQQMCSLILEQPLGKHSFR
jgi:hypothetical protein